MEKNQRNQRKRLNSLILLVAFTAVMLIVSTYAWFTAQKNVTLGNLKGKVNVAEGLEISLDAENWSQEIDFSDTSKYGEDQSGLKKLYGSTDHNIIPSELIPVSMTGKEGVGTVNADGSATVASAVTDLVLYNGKSEVKTASGATSPTTHLSNITATTANAADDGLAAEPTDLEYRGYYAIDFFLRNSSRVATAPASETDAAKLARTYDKLQLNAGSSLALQTTSATSTGLQNTVRAAFALYEPTGAASSSTDVLATKDQIVSATTGTAKIRDVAIWEPNAYDHVDLIKNSQRNDTAYRVLFKATDAASTAYDIPTENIAPSGQTAVNIYKIGNRQLIPTYAVTSGTKTAGTITNVYDWDAGLTTNKLEKQVTLKTDKTDATNFAIAGTAKYLVSTKSTADGIYKKGNEDGAAPFYIPKNQICRIRMYVWLEGQDIDCVNQASHGGGIELDVGLVKDAEVVS